MSVDPIAYDGSASQASSAVASIDVVVVLPCVPVTTTAVRSSITDCTAAERGHSRSPRSLARTTSGLSSWTAVDTTTVSAPSTCAASCPTQQVTPSPRSPSSRTESFASLPVTVTPRATMIRASPDRAAPPMPTKCTRPSSSQGTIRSGIGHPHGHHSRRARPSATAIDQVGQLRRRRRDRISPAAAAPIAAEPVAVGQQRRDVRRAPSRA